VANKAENIKRRKQKQQQEEAEKNFLRTDLKTIAAAAARERECVSDTTCTKANYRS